MPGEGSPTPKAGNKAIRIAADGQPFIEGYRCAACGAVVAEQTMACRACSNRAAPAPFRGAQTGKLWSWSVVERSYPGVKVPFVSAIVDLDDGLTLKGTVLGASASQLKQGLSLRLVFDDAGGARDKDGAS